MLNSDIIDYDFASSAVYYIPVLWLPIPMPLLVFPSAVFVMGTFYFWSNRRYLAWGILFGFITFFIFAVATLATF